MWIKAKEKETNSLVRNWKKKKLIEVQFCNWNIENQTALDVSHATKELSFE